MSRIVIGKAGGHNLSFDLETLLRTRLLVQAASGQGKSHLLRRLCEQLFGKVQIFFIDHEGEFATLRTDYAFTLIGEGGEAMPDVRTAGLLAHRLLELNVSAVFDLSESYRAHPSERRAWVRAFLSAMMEAPRRLWHPVAVIVDEAHKYCPEKDEAESSDAMTSIATDGRKRQFCAIWATQRLAKLNKDAAAELLNKMIGGTSLDIDRKRAADDLGVYGKDLQPFHDEIKVLERGDFWALGPAIAKTRTLVHIGDTVTAPPKMGKHASAPPPAPEKIKALLPQLADLPQEVQRKEQSERDYKAKIRDLETRLQWAERQVKTAKPGEGKLKPDPISARMVQQLRGALKEAINLMAKIATFDFAAASVDRQQVEALVRSVVDRVLGLSAQASATLSPSQTRILRARPSIGTSGATSRGAAIARGCGAGNWTGSRFVVIQQSLQLLDHRLRLSPQLLELFRLLAARAEASSTSSTFQNNLGALRSAGLIDYVNGRVRLTESGKSRVPQVDAPLTSEEMAASCKKLLTLRRSLFSTHCAALTRIRWHARISRRPQAHRRQAPRFKTT